MEISQHVMGQRKQGILLRTRDLYQFSPVLRYARDMIVTRYHPITPGGDSSVGRVALQAK